MQDKSIYKYHAGICKTLGSPLRIEIIDLLQDQELTFGEILKNVKCRKSNLSQHLSVMAGKGILVTRREGVNVYFKLASKKVFSACCLMREVLVETMQMQNEILKQIQ